MILKFLLGIFMSCGVIFGVLYLKLDFTESNLSPGITRVLKRVFLPCFLLSFSSFMFRALYEAFMIAKIEGADRLYMMASGMIIFYIMMVIMFCSCLKEFLTEPWLNK